MRSIGTSLRPAYLIHRNVPAMHALIPMTQCYQSNAICRRSQTALITELSIEDDVGANATRMFRGSDAKSRSGVLGDRHLIWGWMQAGLCAGTDESALSECAVRRNFWTQDRLQWTKLRKIPDVWRWVLSWWPH
jgi:hypothetical protein